MRRQPALANVAAILAVQIEHSNTIDFYADLAVTARHLAIV
jgi:hypothetical protein